VVVGTTVALDGAALGLAWDIGVGVSGTTSVVGEKAAVATTTVATARGVGGAVVAVTAGATVGVGKAAGPIRTGWSVGARLGSKNESVA
jgi:hypothetical protein